MSGPRLILAAHGAGDGSAANRDIAALAERIGAREPYAGGAAAFHLGRPTLLDALREGSGPTVVVPLLTSRGYFFDRLRAAVSSSGEARRNGKFLVTEPVGTHPAVTNIALRQIAKNRRNVTGPIHLLVVGHGTRRHSRSADTTRTLADRLRDRLPEDSASWALLDAPPSLEEVVAEAPSRPLLVFPFLIGGGPHVDSDIPARVRSALPDRTAPTRFLPPLGTGAGIEELVFRVTAAALDTLDDEPDHEPADA